VVSSPVEMSRDSTHSARRVWLAAVALALATACMIAATDAANAAASRRQHGFGAAARVAVRRAVIAASSTTVGRPMQGLACPTGNTCPTGTRVSLICGPQALRAEVDTSRYSSTARMTQPVAETVSARTAAATLRVSPSVSWSRQTVSLIE